MTSRNPISWYTTLLLVLTTCVAVGLIHYAVPGTALPARQGSRQTRALAGHPDMLAMCDVACSNGDWCPLWCPEHTLFPGKRSDRPFTDEDLSFDDYVFLKLMGRTRK
jgi:hypothetical protein